MKIRVPDWVRSIERKHFGAKPVAPMEAPTEEFNRSSASIMDALDRCRSAEAMAGEHYAHIKRQAQQAKTFTEQQQFGAEAELARRRMIDFLRKQL